MLFSFGLASPGQSYAGMEILAPAKINLSLRVHGRRPDGFHEVETLMVGLGLCDRLEIELCGGKTSSLTCCAPGIPTGPENLVIKAADAFFAATGIGKSARIHLEKRIPHGAGLGGGSSDAAATLVALDHLTGSSLGHAKLEEIAATFGSDTAWFVRAQPAICRGRGEILEPADPVPPKRILLIKPPFGVATPWAYKAWGELGGIPGEEQSCAWGTLRNDLEPPVFRKYAMLQALKEWLLARAEVEGSLMSGSGSTIFAVLAEGADAALLATDAKTRFGETLFVEDTRILEAA